MKQYKWNIYEIKRLRKIAELKKDKITLENAQIMLEILGDKLDVTQMKIVEPKSTIKYKDAYKDYAGNLEFVPESILDLCMGLFLKDGIEGIDFALDARESTPFDVSDKELVDMTYDCLSELRTKKVLKIFNEIVRDDHQYLNICHDSHPSGQSQELAGVCFNDRINHRSYINLFREGTAHDFQTLVHEFMHSIFFKLMPMKNYSIDYFQELEGRFGNAIAVDFLRRNGMEKYAEELEIDECIGAFYDSYMLYLNDLLFGLSKNNRFNLKEVSKVYEEETGDKWYYKKEDLPDLLCIYGFDTSTDLLSYMIIQDIMRYGIDLREKFEAVREIKKNDNMETLLNIDSIGLSFPTDGYDTIMRLQKKIKDSN